MLNKKVSELIKQQVIKEVYSSYLYMAFANYFREKGLKGFEHWYDIQAKEELDHAKMFIKYLHNKDEDLDNDEVEVDKPTVMINDPLKVLEKGLNHEKYVTSLLKAIYNAAVVADDEETAKLLTWYLDEQKEEEENATDLIEKFKDCESKEDLIKLDAELGKREYKEPTLVI